MRKSKAWNAGWQFAKPGQPPVAVTLPHTWNAGDGTDGGSDYYRGTCTYIKEFSRPESTQGEQLWLEVTGAAMSAAITLNGKRLANHMGGYSTFRVELTPALLAENRLEITVDNGKNRTVYPQKADFTFYGGLYREVNLIAVPAAHFDLSYYGGNGLTVTPKIADDYKSAVLTLEAYTQNAPDGAEVLFTVPDVGSCTCTVRNGRATAQLTIENVHLWDGVADPYLYSCTATLDSGDEVSTKFGCRTIAFTPDKGFFLNGKNLRLVGAARHQDREGLGSALTRKEHEEDMSILREMGANTVRLAHYQHAQYFYDLCDRYGLVAWAEIPYITEHMDEADENAVTQMTELVVQNYNHPSIICWGLSNEITASGPVTEDMLATHKRLNELCHTLDATRPTTMAYVFMLDPNSDFVMLPDIRSYNLYYGWYLGELGQNDEWFDTFHAVHPDTVIGLSEFGADANPAYQSAKPEKGDWSESYQAVYHEHMLEMWAARPYIWAMHVWNGFDFGADGRDEGGKPGQNQKGLVTFDRQTKKDAFYIYKAYLSKAPFVHLCGSRYVDRTESETEIKVYSNLPEVTLYVDGKEFAVKAGDKIFTFTVPITGRHTIEAVSGECSDRIQIQKVEKPNTTYHADGGAVVNWFDKPEEVLREGYYSIMDSMESLKQNPASAALLAKIMAKATASYGDVAKNVQMPEAVQRQMDKAPLASLLKQAGKAVGPEMIKNLNAALNQIKKEIE